jgi:peptide/nickel transport system substrate-binding protein
MMASLSYRKAEMPVSLLGANRLAAASLVLVAALAVSGCAGGATTDQDDASATLVGGITRPASGTDPLADFTQSSTYLRAPILSDLISVDADGELSPDAALEWSSNDDATVWTLTLREQEYLDGTPFDANLVVSALDAALDPEAPASGVTGLVGLLSRGGAVAVDDQTVQFTLDLPYSNFAYALAGIELNWLPDGTDTADYASGDIGGTGQYLVESFDADSGVTFTKNPDYWGADDIAIDTLRLRFYDDDQAIALALQAGEIDFIPNLSAASVPVLENADGVEILVTPSSAHNAIRFNVDAAPFDDVRVREAIATAVDRQALVDTLFGGDASVGNDNVWAPIFPEGQAVADAVPQREQDLDASRALLAEAGYPDGISVTLTIPDTTAVTALAQLVKSQVADAGITVTIESLPEGDYYGSLDDVAAPWLSAPFAITPWATRTDPSALVRSAYVSGATFNESHYANSEFDELIAQYDAESDEQARALIAEQIAAIQTSDVPAIIAYFAPGYRAVSDDVQNFPTGPVASTLDLAGVTVER